MLTTDIIQHTVSTIGLHGAGRVFFCLFSSKKTTTPLPSIDYTQSLSEDFPRCYFTGKERDEETGYGYFGARYMDHELLTSFISVDRYASKYPFISPYAYCAWNPIRLTDPNGDSIALTEKEWKVMENAIKSTLLQGNKKKANPFYYKNGYVHYDESVSYETDNEKLQEIHDHLKGLTINETYKVVVELVDNNMEFDAVDESEQWGKTTLKKEGAYGFAQPNDEKNTGCHVYISNHPQRKDGSYHPQKDDYMSITFLHEVGGHAYNYLNNIYGSANNRNTEAFEQICRDVFKGLYGSPDIRNGKVKQHN